MSEALLLTNIEASADLNTLRHEMFSASLLAQLDNLEAPIAKADGERLLNALNTEYNAAKIRLNDAIKVEIAAIKDETEVLKNAERSASAKRIANLEDAYKRLDIETRNTPETLKQHKDALSGERTVLQRALLKIDTERERLTLIVKQKRANLQMLKADYAAKIKGKKVSVLDNLINSFLTIQANFNLKKKLRTRSTWLNLMPVIMLVVLFIAHVIACHFTGYKLDFDSIITYGIYVAVVAVGAVFIYAQGAFDMSLGASTLITAAMTGLMYGATHNIYLSLLIAVLLGMFLGIINSLLAGFLKLPVMVMTLTMLNILNAVFAAIAESQENGFVYIMEIRQFNSVGLKWLVLVGFTIFAYIIFNYTKIGRQNKMIGSNPINAQFSGVSIKKAGIIAFAISGIGLGLTGFLFTLQNGYVNTGTAIDVIGLNVIIAITMGGMPTSGGPRSKISAAIIGAFFAIIMDEFFAAMSIANYRFLAKGVIYLIIVLINSYEYRTKLLAR